MTEETPPQTDSSETSGTLPVQWTEMTAIHSKVDRILDAMNDLKAIRTFVAKELKAGIDFGQIPGTTEKMVLLQPGMEKICMYFNLRPFYEVKRTEIDPGSGHFEVYVETALIGRDDNKNYGAGVGSCTTMETKFRYRQAERKCPKCGKAAIYRGKKFKPTDPETWFCWKKKDGCGTVFAINDPEITSQDVGQKENPNIWDQRNTVLKFACKRSLGKAVQGVGCLSELFTVDLEDFFDLEPPTPSGSGAGAEPAKEKTHVDVVDKTVGGKMLLEQAAEDFLLCKDFIELLDRYQRDLTAAHRYLVIDDYKKLKLTAFLALREFIEGEPLVPIPSGDQNDWLEFYALDEAYRTGNRELANKIYFNSKESMGSLTDAWKQYAVELKRTATT